MKALPLASCLLALASLSHSGDWGKVPVPKVPIEECIDLGGEVEIGYASDYIYKGLLIGGDTVIGNLSYQFEGLGLPITVSADYANIVSPNEFSNVFDDQLALAARVGLPSFAGIDSALSYTHRFYPEDPNNALWPSSHGEIGLHLSRDLSIAVLKFNAYYNLNLPDAWNGTIPTVGNDDSGAWFWDIGIERRFEVYGQSVVLGGGVGFADNYWGTAPGLQTGGRSSGWNHYYLSASVPIELNCRTVLTPYLGYLGAPEGWLMDGAPDWANRPAQSDLLHGGVNLSVSF